MDTINNIICIENIIVIIIGLIIGIFIGYFYFNKSDYIGPDSNEIKKNIYYEENGVPYRLLPEICICPISYSMNLLHNPENIIKIKH